MSFDQEQDGLLFDVRRSIRYHDRRRAFFEVLHRMTAVLTILLAGSVLFALAIPGEMASWMVCLAVLASILTACDMVIGYATVANRHAMLRARFCDLEISVLSAQDPAAFNACQLDRLTIERDEPPVYRALDLYCYAELCAAEGRERPANFPPLRWFHALTSQFYTWPNIANGGSI
jgi:hypothetical protein